MKNFSERKKEMKEMGKLINILPMLLEKIVYLVMLIFFIKCLLNSNV
jgi:biopolymer transport protein ExbD